ncbi:hypothetical protein [Actinomadura gamaensis]|uniref:Uncharacterized protein n=1 Tax=Actinomadura gamaensis TaxID=1763541 RepID=A0ABV9U8U6_9ACTN
MNQPHTVPLRRRMPVQTGRDRTVELLADLQLGLCGRCGRARYATRRQARRAARIGMPGRRLRAYRCADAWHLTSHSRPQYTAPPVTLPPPPGTGSKPTKTPAPQPDSTAGHAGLALDRRAERASTHGHHTAERPDGRDDTGRRRGTAPTPSGPHRPHRAYGPAPTRADGDPGRAAPHTRSAPDFGPAAGAGAGGR